MFPDVVIGPGLLVDPVALKTAVRHVLLVDAPADALGIEQVYDGLDAGRNTSEPVASDAVGVSSRGGNVVRLGGEVTISL